MGKYTELLTRARESVEFWTQSAMRSFVSDVLRRMDNRKTSRAELAEKMGVSPAYVSKILRGDVNFTLESMVKVASALGGRVSISIVDASTVEKSKWCRIDMKRELTSGSSVVGIALRTDNNNWRQTVVGPPQTCPIERAAA